MTMKTVKRQNSSLQGDMETPIGDSRKKKIINMKLAGIWSGRIDFFAVGMFKAT